MQGARDHRNIYAPEAQRNPRALHNINGGSDVIFHVTQVSCVTSLRLGSFFDFFFYPGCYFKDLLTSSFARFSEGGAVPNRGVLEAIFILAFVHQHLAQPQPKGC